MKINERRSVTMKAIFLILVSVVAIACTTSDPTPTPTSAALTAPIPPPTSFPITTPTSTPPSAPTSPPTSEPTLETSEAQLQAFHIPPTMTGTVVDGKKTYDLVMRPGTTEFLPGKQTATLGYNGNYLGPTLIMNKGDEVVINVTNDLGGPPTTTHWHGFHVPAKDDGGPHQEILNGETWSPTFTVMNRAGTYWYHPHLHPVADKMRNPNGTSGQVFQGLAGLIIVRDEESEQLALPKQYGVDDIPLILQDRSFNQDGSFLAFPMYRTVPIGGPFEIPLRKGDKSLVNGVISPVLETHAQMVRFRILNAANNRIYNLGFSDNRTFYQIGSDGGLLEAPVPLKRLIISPSQRMEIVVDFGNDENTSVRLKSYASELGAIHVPDVIADEYDRTDFDIFTFAVGPAAGNPVTALPESLTKIERISPDEAVNFGQPRTFELSYGLVLTPDGNDVDPFFLINGKEMDIGRIDEIVQLGDTEIWEITNVTDQSHPMHVHGDSFQVLSRNGSFDNVLANERGWLDVVVVKPGDTVQIIKRFEDFSDSDAPYMFHCHILDHEDAGMMQQFIVVEPGSMANTPEPSPTPTVTAEPEPTATGVTQIALQPIKDNTLYESSDGSVSNGAGSHLFSGTNNRGEIRRAVIAFDIAGNIPTGATIRSVSLRLNMTRTAGGSATVSLHKVLADWGQAASDAERNEGGGTASTSGDATWVHRFFNAETWEKAGGDFSETASASTVVGDQGPYVWGPASGMATDVQSWLDNPNSNFGWALIGEESSNQTAKRFDSMENSTATNRPNLIVEFHIKTP